MVAYTGIETVANLGSEARQPSKNIPRTVLLVFATVFVLYTLLSMTALSAYPVYQFNNHWVTDLTQQFLNNPIMGITYALPESIRHFLSFWVAFLAVTILIIASNAGIIGASRLAYFMGLRQQLPSTIAAVNSRSRVPLKALIVIAILACLLILVGQVTILADLYAFGAMFAYTTAHISVITLRIKEPNLPRPFKIPLNIRIRGKAIPITAIIGGLATASTWLIVIWTHQYGRVVGFVWVVIGVLIYVIYRRSTHRPIFRKIEIKSHVKIRR
jgi:APA family basic amino acid/polyamine antiporter